MPQSLKRVQYGTPECMVGAKGGIWSPLCRFKVVLAPRFIIVTGKVDTLADYRFKRFGNSNRRADCAVKKQWKKLQGSVDHI